MFCSDYEYDRATYAELNPDCFDWVPHQRKTPVEDYFRFKNTEEPPLPPFRSNRKYWRWTDNSENGICIIIYSSLSSLALKCRQYLREVGFDYPNVQDHEILTLFYIWFVKGSNEYAHDPFRSRPGEKISPDIHSSRCYLKDKFQGYFKNLSNGDILPFHSKFDKEEKKWLEKRLLAVGHEGFFARERYDYIKRTLASWSCAEE